MNDLKAGSIPAFIGQLQLERFYGSLELKFEAGRVVLIRKSETFKPTESNYGNNRSEHDEFRS